MLVIVLRHGARIIHNGDTEKRLQDLTIIFEKRSPSVYISKPYSRNNAVMKIRDGVADDE